MSNRRQVLIDLNEVRDELTAVKVVHGHWEPECKNRRRCSHCGLGRNIETQVGWDYCPRCGADMRGEQDGQ